MSLLGDLFDSKPNQQTSEEARANYEREQVLYQAALDRRHAQGTISDRDYQLHSEAIRDTLENPDDAAYDEFKTAVSQEVSSAGTYIKEIPGQVGAYAGETVGKFVSGTGGGIVKGLFGNSAWFSGTFLIVAVLAFVLWKPLLKPLLGKIKIIPV